MERVLESALRRGDVTLDEVRAALDRSPRSQRGRGTLRRILDRHPGIPTGSDFETRVAQLMREGRLPEPVRQYRINDEQGRFVGQADFAFLAQRLVVEADGYGSHSKPEDWKRDRRRQNEFVRLGWRVYRVTWDDLMKRPGRVGSDIAELLGARP